MKQIKILILDDNEIDAKMIQHELKKSGLDFMAKAVGTRQSYEEALHSFVPDIILSDYLLDSFDGSTAFQIKEEQCPHTPFIIISGIIGEENAVELIKAGVSDYSPKSKLVSLDQKIIRAIKEANAVMEKRRTDETIKAQNRQLLEIASLQSHQVRAPIASILGLANLFDYNDPSNPMNAEVLANIKKVVEQLDAVVHEIVKNTSELNKIG
jgi:DNA-binding NtrC family response regulator